MKGLSFNVSKNLGLEARSRNHQNLVRGGKKWNIEKTKQGSVTITKTTNYVDESDSEYDPSKRKKINNAWV